MTDGKRYTSIKKVSLAGLSEGYDESCYAYVQPATFETRRKVFESLSSDSGVDEQLKFQELLVREHFVSGKVKVFDGNDFIDGDLSVEDAVVIPDISNAIVNGLMGIDLDPKGTGKELADMTLPHSESKATETQ